MTNSFRRRFLALWVVGGLLIGGFVGRASAVTQPVLAGWLYTSGLDLDHSEAPGETREGYLVRMEVIATELAGASRKVADGRGWTASELAMAILTLWHEETRFDERIHAGTKHPVWHEDYGRAKCLGQLHASLIIPKEQWAELTGTDHGRTRLCADATVKVWTSMAKQCGVWYGQRASRNAVAKTFAAYGSGGKCAPNDRAWARADKWLGRMGNRPDRSPVKGYRRLLPSAVPPEIRARAEQLVAAGNLSPGTRHEVGPHILYVERHAAGKIGVSVLVAE